MSELAVRDSPAPDAPDSRIRLREGGMLKVQGGRGVRILALEGRLWIIQETDVQDFEIEAGQSLQIGIGGVALIQAVKASTLSLLPASHRHGAVTRPTVNLVGTG